MNVWDLRMRVLVAIMPITLVMMSAFAEVRVEMADYGIRPGTGKDMSARMAKALGQIEEKYRGEEVTLSFAPGRYDFWPEKAAEKNYFISNHDQEASKRVGICIDGMADVTIDGNGADIVCHGRMLPIAIVGSKNSKLRNLSIDFAQPHVSQAVVKENGSDGIVFETAPWVNADIDKKSRFVVKGEGWTNYPRLGMAFEPDTRHIVYNTSDIWIPLDSVVKLGKSTFRAPRWQDHRLKPGTVVVLRTGARPAPGIYVAGSTDTRLEDITVHYAEGMGLLAQLSENITLSGFEVALRGDDDPRYFTTQADATHFSGCKGVITSTDGLYENMMDDAINVHGTYLKVVGNEGPRTLVGRYMHDQSYGFDWGWKGDSVSFIRSKTMEIVGDGNVIESIEPAGYDDKTGGVRLFRITFAKDVPVEINTDEGFGIENLTWTPSVTFARNTVRNNRARGCLFSTPRPTLVEENLFDHTSGTAVLLCGDCNGWYETGACRDVLIRKNRFRNALTSLFQFTEAIISIYPEIPDLEAQTKFFHGGVDVPGVRIEENVFDTFDNPILFAKSIQGLKFTGNIIRHNEEYPPFHGNRFNFRLLKCADVQIDSNDFGSASPSILFE